MLRQVHEAVTKCIDAAVKARSQRQKARQRIDLVCRNGCCMCCVYKCPIYISGCDNAIDMYKHAWHIAS